MKKINLLGFDRGIGTTSIALSLCKVLAYKGSKVLLISLGGSIHRNLREIPNTRGLWKLVPLIETSSLTKDDIKENMNSYMGIYLLQGQGHLSE